MLHLDRGGVAAFWVARTGALRFLSGSRWPALCMPEEGKRPVMESSWFSMPVSRLVNRDSRRGFVLPAKKSSKIPADGDDKHAGQIRRHAPPGYRPPLTPPRPVRNPPTRPHNQRGAASRQETIARPPALSEPPEKPSARRAIEVCGLSQIVYCTTTFAVIFGWIEQKYVYVPGFVNV